MCISNLSLVEPVESGQWKGLSDSPTSSTRHQWNFRVQKNEKNDRFFQKSIKGH